MEVVDLDYAFGCCHPLADFTGVQAAGGRFEQDIGRVSQERPGAAQDQEPDGYAYQGVGVAPPVRMIMAAATIAPTEPRASASTWRRAPSTFRLSPPVL